MSHDHLQHHQKAEAKLDLLEILSLEHYANWLLVHNDAELTDIRTEMLKS